MSVGPVKKFVTLNTVSSKFQNIRNNIFLYTIVPLTILAIATSFYRFMVTYDYLVTYEGFCDPYTESCFVYCEDDECTDPAYNTWVTRKASVVVEQCGDIILDCAAADQCISGEDACVVEYCVPGGDEECDGLTENDQNEAVMLNESDL